MCCLGQFIRLFLLNSLHTAGSCSILHQDNQTENRLLPLTSSPFPPRCPPKHAHCTNPPALKSLLFFMTTTLVYLNQLLVPIFCLLNTPFPHFSCFQIICFNYTQDHIPPKL